MKILNLGCGVKTSDNPNVINIDWSIKLVLKNNKILKFLSNIFLSSERRQSIDDLPSNILVHDLVKGIPFDDNSIDVVYHSHLLEHIDRDKVNIFLKEIKRVLKKNGIHRIVVPDLNHTCKKYMESYENVLNGKNDKIHHDAFIAQLIEQSVRKEPHGTSKQRRIIRFFENKIFGDARKRGETHQWLYDQINLSNLLEEEGFRFIERKEFNESRILNWNNYSLDRNKFGDEYKPYSLYIESQK